MKLRLAECDGFLDWDSYVELRELVRVTPPELREALARPDNPIGRVNEQIARQIAFAAKQAVTLSEELSDIVWEGLVGGV